MFDQRSQIRVMLHASLACITLRSDLPDSPDTRMVELLQRHGNSADILHIFHCIGDIGVLLALESGLVISMVDIFSEGLVPQAIKLCLVSLFQIWIQLKSGARYLRGSRSCRF